jgi:hypothetical protein
MDDELVESGFVFEQATVVQGPGSDDRLMQSVGGLQRAAERQGPDQQGGESHELECTLHTADLLWGQLQVGDVAGQDALLARAVLLPPRLRGEQANTDFRGEREAGYLVHRWCHLAKDLGDPFGQVGMALGVVQHGEAVLCHEWSCREVIGLGL